MDKGKSKLESTEVFHLLADFVSVHSVCADEHNCDKKYLNRQFEALLIHHGYKM